MKKVVSFTARTYVVGVAAEENVLGMREEKGLGRKAKLRLLRLSKKLL